MIWYYNVTGNNLQWGDIHWHDHPCAFLEHWSPAQR